MYNQFKMLFVSIKVKFKFKCEIPVDNQWKLLLNVFACFHMILIIVLRT